MWDASPKPSWSDRITLGTKITLILLPGAFAVIALSAWLHYQVQQLHQYRDESVVHTRLLHGIYDLEIQLQSSSGGIPAAGQINALLDNRTPVHDALAGIITRINEASRNGSTADTQWREAMHSELIKVHQQLLQQIASAQTAANAAQGQLNTIAIAFTLGALLLIIAGFIYAPGLILTPIRRTHDLSKLIAEGKGGANDLLADQDLNQILALMRSTAHELQRTREKLSHAATFDPVTRTYTAKAFLEQLNYEALRANRYKDSVFSLLLIELDHFSAIKKSFGEKVINDILGVIAKILLDQVRTTDYVSHFKEAEFITLLPETAVDGAVILANRIREGVMIQTKAMGTQVSVSIGIASYHTHARSANELLARSYDALARAKQNDRHPVAVAMLPGEHTIN